MQKAGRTRGGGNSARKKREVNQQVRRPQRKLKMLTKLLDWREAGKDAGVWLVGLGVGWERSKTPGIGAWDEKAEKGTTYSGT